MRGVWDWGFRGFRVEGLCEGSGLGGLQGLGGFNVEA